MSQHDEACGERDGANPALPEQPQKKTGKFIGIGTGVLVVAFAAGFGIKALTGSDDKSDPKQITVGTSDPYWTRFKKVGKEQHGLDIKIFNFSDYTQADPVLVQNQLNLNQFQHLQYLADYNRSAKQDLTPIGAT